MTDFEGLIPLPKSIIKIDGYFTIDSNFDTHIDFICKALAKKELPQEGLSFTKERLFIKPNTFCKSEGYILTISKDSIVIEASTTSGAFYAMKTLQQLTMTAKECIACARIEDEPLCAWRGFLLDTSRYFYPVVFLKKIVDLLAFHKFNRFHWHLTDDQGWRLPVKEYPLLTKIGGFHVALTSPPITKEGGFYTEEEIQELIAYADERHITIVPEIDVPGHCSSVLAAYPGLGCTGGPYKVQNGYGIFDEVLCAGKEEVLIMLEKVFDTVCRLFPGDYVHIGGDECPRTSWKDCPSCKQKMIEEGMDNVNQIQAWFTSKISNMVKKHGKIVIGWDEVLDGIEKFPLPQDLIVQSWQGVEGGEKASKNGHNVIMSPQTDGCYLNYYHSDDPMEAGNLDIASVEKSYSFNPVPNKGSKGFYLGGQASFWSEFIQSSKQAEYMIFPRLCAIAECLWLPKEEKDFDSFAKRLDTHKKRLDKLDVQYYRGPLK